MNILLLSTYEMGRQPLALAWPLAALEAAGFAASARDLAVQDFPEQEAAAADLVAISVPMHTALRLGVETARQVRKINSRAHLCFYGLYAHLNAAYLLDSGLADTILAGEFEPELVDLASSLGQQPPIVERVRLRRVALPRPQRAGLPALDAYARLDLNGVMRLAGYTEATRGCLHTCTHCPVVPVYNGRFFAVPMDTVLEDVRQQAAAGARHITFGDPDFLNGPTHALRVARALHAAFPEMTFDFTAKVEHLVQHADLLPELVDCGALFVVSAFESTSDSVLQRLEKGHCAADLDRALDACRAANLAVQPTWVAFTPWTGLTDYLDMLNWVRSRGLAGDVPPVQYAIRLLVPPKSRLLETAPPGTFGPLDAENYTHTWAHTDPTMDELHRRVTEIVEHTCGSRVDTVFLEVEELAYGLADLTLPAADALFASVPSPRMTEDWFC